MMGTWWDLRFTSQNQILINQFTCVPDAVLGTSVLVTNFVKSPCTLGPTTTD